MAQAGRMNPKAFFGELKRRNVYKVAVAYAIVGWLLVQITTQVFPFLEIPNWVVRLVIALVAIGFPIALVIAWAFEITPQGIERTEVADTMQAAAGQKKHAWIYVAIIGAVLSIGLFFLGRYGFRNASPSASEVPPKSIAVLPFDNLSEEKGNAYFAEGIQDEILTRLAKVADLKVISRTSTQHFKSAPDNLPQIAKQLGVMHILEGSVQKANDQVRVNVQLINALTDAHLWADTFDRKLTAIFAVETEIAKTIADTLQAKLSGSEKNAISKKPTENPAAHELYLQGRYFWSKRSAANLRKSIDYFNQAIAQDPNYALAYAGLAQAWMVDRKSTRLNSSHRCISYAVFCLKKKKYTKNRVHYGAASGIANDPKLLSSPAIRFVFWRYARYAAPSATSRPPPDRQSSDHSLLH